MIIIPANTLSTGGYNVANSCRFNDGDSPELNFTVDGTPTHQDKGTWSFWIKRGNILGAVVRIFSAYADGGQTQTWIRFDTNDNLDIANRVSAAFNTRLVTNRVFRDASAWYHIVVAFDSSQGTASNRVKLYVNGVQETSFGTETYPSLNDDLEANTNGIPLTWGAEGVGNGEYFDGYMAEVVFIDGTALDATSFGEFDADSGAWKAIDVSGLTFGTNGFYLDFEDSAALGNDANGGTDFTVNNLTSIDQTTDTPTNNFATMNPLDNYYANSTFSEGNLKTVQGSSRYAWNLSTIGVSSGKWYVETKLTTSGSYALIGITDQSPTQNLNDVLGSDAYDYSIYQLNGDIFNSEGANPSNDGDAYAASYANGDIIGIALDLDNNKLYFSKGGVWSDGSGDWGSSTFNASTGVVTITASASTNNGNYFFAAGDYESGSQPTFEWNFGNPTFSISSGNADGNSKGNFEYLPPEGYFALCTANLAEFG